jgi:hypothetical protein
VITVIIPAKCVKCVAYEYKTRGPSKRQAGWCRKHRKWVMWVYEKCGWANGKKVCKDEGQEADEEHEAS